MASPISKRPARRMSAGHSPDPTGLSLQASSCGHGGCHETCAVRYCGPTTHLRDHYALHASRGVANVWPAAIISGLAIVLTGALAQATLEIAKPEHAEQKMELAAEVQSINTRLDTLDAMVDAMTAAHPAKPSTPVQTKLKAKR